jgi:hypothetical protein
LDTCNSALTFTILIKNGSQASRITWEDEAKRLSGELAGEKNVSADYKEKWGTMKELYTTCDNGYSAANVTITFLVRLTNEKSGEVENCQTALNASRNDSKDLSEELKGCKARVNASEEAHNGEKIFSLFFFSLVPTFLIDVINNLLLSFSYIHRY